MRAAPTTARPSGGPPRPDGTPRERCRTIAGRSRGAHLRRRDRPLSAAAFAAVGVGAALGAWFRWLLGIALNAALPQLPLGTLAANLLGGYMIGLAVAWFESAAGLAPEMRLLIVTGFLGGLTTFSTFSGESVALLMSGRYGWAALHAGSHLAGSLALTVLGIKTYEWLR